LAINNQSVNGNRPDSNALSVDGGFNMDSGSNASQVNNVGIDFIREVAIKSSTFLRNMTKLRRLDQCGERSGGDSYHGTVFEFIRNEETGCEKTRGAKNPPAVQRLRLGFWRNRSNAGKLFFFRWRGMEKGYGSRQRRQNEDCSAAQRN